MIGIPYAPAGIDQDGYYVTCPECGAQFYGTDEFDKVRRSDDEITKLANQCYAEHYALWHKEG